MNQGGGSYFLRYLSNGWESGKNYYTSNFKDLKWVADLGFVYKSGDTLLSYPEYDINNDANYNQIHQYDKNENKLSSVDYIPSIRYEMLNEGRKLASKVTELLINNKISNDYLNSNISTLNKFSKRLSVNKFNLDYNLINFKAKPINTSSIIMRLLFQGQRDEITALKNIVNLVKNTK